MNTQRDLDKESANCLIVLTVFAVCWFLIISGFAVGFWASITINTYLVISIFAFFTYAFFINMEGKNETS